MARPAAGTMVVTCPMGCHLLLAIPLQLEATKPKPGQAAVRITLVPDFTPMRDHMAARHDLDLDASLGMDVPAAQPHPSAG